MILSLKIGTAKVNTYEHNLVPKCGEKVATLFLYGLLKYKVQFLFYNKYIFEVKEEKS